MKGPRENFRFSLDNQFCRRAARDGSIVFNLKAQNFRCPVRRFSWFGIDFQRTLNMETNVKMNN